MRSSDWSSDVCSSDLGAGPCFFMDWNPPGTWHRMAGFLKGVAGTLPARPRAIVLVSAHWLEPQFSITGHARPQLISDSSGFPQYTYELPYSHPGVRKRLVKEKGCSVRGNSGVV